MHASLTRRDLFVFLSTLFALTWAVQIAAIVQVGDLNQPGAMPYLLACMFLPTVWTLGWLWRRPVLRQAFRWRFGNPLFSLLGALLPAVLALAVLLAVAGLGWGTSTNFALSSGSVEVLKGPWQLGLGVQSWPWFLLNFALTGAFFGVLNASTAVGEEIGWRGFLQGPMIARWGVLPGVALLGVIWAFWHLPANLAGYNFGETPVLGAFVLFPLQLVADSFVMAWLTRRAGSFWPAAFYHGSGNGILQSVAHATMQPSVPRWWIDVLVVAITLAAGALAAWALVRRERRGTAEVPGTLGAVRAA